MQFDPVTIELNGRRLIEASAGTGKTHSISNLVLRAVLGIGTPRPLGIDEILVVTFTRAACAELKRRIRQRLVVARKVLASGNLDDDSFIKAICSGMEEPRIVESLARLELAARSVDEASIYTIHGFCQRALADFAFSFGLPFEQELEEDPGSQKHQILLDWWRSLETVIDSEEKSILAEWGHGPNYYKDQLLKNIGIESPLPEAEKFESIKTLVQRFKDSWPEARELFEDYKGGHGGRRPFNKKDHYLALMDEFVASDYLSIESFGLDWNIYSQQSLEKNTKKNFDPLQHEAFEIASQLAEVWTGRVMALKVKIARHYLDCLKRHQQSSAMDFDRLVLLLDEQLEVGKQYPAMLAKRYPLVMVDEFQDTDKAQFRIFSSIANAGSGLLMIGDPKQAIYRFRGADIHAYLTAREAAKCYGMSTNWRSSQQLVDVVNHLFDQPDKPPFVFENIPYERVVAAGKADETPFTLDGESTAAMTVHYAGKQAAWDIEHSLMFTAREVRFLLDSSCTVGDKALSPGEVAVLVRSNNQAAQLQRMLRQQSVASIIISDDSVFQTAVAKSLLHILRAVLKKDSVNVICTALASRLIGFSVGEISQLRQNNQQLAGLQQQFRDYHELWDRHGISVAARRLMADFKIPQYLIQQAEGQRDLADLVHLLELLQKQSRELPGSNKLFDWLLVQMQPGQHADVPDDEKIMLETEHKLVKIMTIHRSKGLQYDVVFIPKLQFGGHPKTSFVSYYQHGEEFFTVEADDQEKEILQQEELAEDLRLLYVALTRARYRVIANLFRENRPGKAFDCTAIAYLLGFEKNAEKDQEKLALLEQASVDVIEHFEKETIVLDKPKIKAQEKENTLKAQPWPEFDRSWRVGSFSALVGSLGHLLPGAGDEAVEVDELQVYPETVVNDIRFNFTRGAQAGNFLHDVLEYYLAENTEKRNLKELLQSHWQKYHFIEDFQLIKNSMQKWLESVLAADLGDGLTLGQLETSQLVTEMEFYLPLDNSLQASKLNGILQQYGYQTTTPLVFSTLEGYLKGYIDLVYESQGRFYLADYKSNHLGDSFEAYDKASLKQAIRQHHYQLQYVLYTLALHRYLKSRVPGYCYSKHIGGVRYLFLRGMNKEGQSGIYHDVVPEEMIEKLDVLFFADQRNGVSQQSVTAGQGND